MVLRREGQHCPKTGSQPTRLGNIHPRITDKWLAWAGLEPPLHLTLEVVESVTLVFLWEVSVQMLFVFLLGCLPFNPCFVGDFYDS